MSEGAVRLDATAKRIIELLQEDGRISYAAIAKAVGLSEAAARARVQKLLDSDVMQVVAVTDPTQVGFTRPAMIGVRLDRVGELQQRLLALRGRRTSPLAEGALCRVVRRVDVLRAADRRVGHHLPGRGVDDVAVRAGAGVDVGAADEVAQRAWAGHVGPPGRVR